MITDTTRSLEWSRHKDRYIGSLYLDIGIVLGEIGILPEYRGVTGTPPGVIGSTWAIREKRRAGQGRPRAPSPQVQIGQGRGGGAPLSSFPFPFPSPTRQEGGVLLPVGVGLLQAHP